MIEKRKKIDAIKTYAANKLSEGDFEGLSNQGKIKKKYHISKQHKFCYAEGIQMHDWWNDWAMAAKLTNYLSVCTVLSRLFKPK